MIDNVEIQEESLLHRLKSVGNNRDEIERILGEEFIHLEAKSRKTIEDYLKEKEIDPSEFLLSSFVGQLVWKLNYSSISEEEKINLIDKLKEQDFPPKIWYLLFNTAKSNSLKNICLMKMMHEGVDEALIHVSSAV